MSNGMSRDAKPNGDGGAGEWIRTGGHPIAAAADALLAQASAMLEVVPASAYTAASVSLNGSTIGQHLRHNLDHFMKLVRGHAAGEVVDYDHRDRGVPIETEPKVAAACIEELRRSIAGFDAATLGQGVRIRIMINAEGHCEETGSTLGRELAFVTHHAIHHHAMIKAIAGERGIGLGAAFGKAPSTTNAGR